MKWRSSLMSLHLKKKSTSFSLWTIMTIRQGVVEVTGHCLYVAGIFGLIFWSLIARKGPVQRIENQRIKYVSVEIVKGGFWTQIMYWHEPNPLWGKW